MSETALVPGGPTAIDVPADVTFTGLSDPTIQQFDYQSFKGRKGVTDRITILSPDTHVAHAWTHYVEGEGGGFLRCSSTWRKQGTTDVCVKKAPCCESFGDPKRRVVVAILHYATDSNGNPLTPFTYTPKLWVIGVDKFDQLRGIHGEFNLNQHDIKVTCTEETYQKLTIQATKESIAASPAFAEKFGADVKAWLEGITQKMPRALGRKLSDAEWREKAGADVPAPVTTDAAPVLSIEDMLK